MNRKTFFLFNYINLILSSCFFVINIASCGQKQHEESYVWLPDPTLTRDNRIVTSNSVVFLGDSLTNMAVWIDYFPNIETANQGIGGNRTSDVLGRLDEVLVKKPKKIFLLIGTNDVLGGVPLSIIIQNLSAIIRRIATESPGTALYVQSIFPYGRSKDKNSHTNVIALNKVLMNLSVMYNAQYINVYHALADGGLYLKKQYTTDKLHLSQQGYQVWVNTIRPFVME